jgi:hypothetical protein
MTLIKPGAVEVRRAFVKQKKISTAIPIADAVDKEINPQKRTTKVHTTID